MIVSDHLYGSSVKHSTLLWSHSLTGMQQASSPQVVKQGNIVVPTSGDGLIDINGLHLAENLLAVGTIYRVRSQ